MLVALGLAFALLTIVLTIEACWWLAGKARDAWPWWVSMPREVAQDREECPPTLRSPRDPR